MTRPVTPRDRTRKLYDLTCQLPTCGKVFQSRDTRAKYHTRACGAVARKLAFTGVDEGESSAQPERIDGQLRMATYRRKLAEWERGDRFFHADGWAQHGSAREAYSLIESMG